jgi:hypothetical protein
VMDPGAFARSSPLEQQTWILSVARERVTWQRTGVLRPREFEFDPAAWGGVPPQRAPRRVRRR